MATIDMARHRALEDAGFLQINTHAQAPLLIHNYTAKAQFDRHWVPETLQSRGLITDLEGNILARPFPKFFNLDEHISLHGAVPNEPFEVYEKMDGSLGILYFQEGKPRIATRGSFHSEQAERANLILQRRYGHVHFDPALTYLFEIIYPENRVVVDYGGLEDLVLLGITDTKSGEELPLSLLPEIPSVRRYDGINDLNVLRGLQEANREGFVVRFQSGLLVKLKFEEYVRLHRILTGVNARMVWEYLSTGQDMTPFLEQVPDEFYKWVQGVEADLRAQYAAIEAEAKSEFLILPTRKESADYYKQCKHPHILFRMLDGKPYGELIWKMIYPAHKPGFALDTDA